jgi:Alpha-glutamyl/putrescinyl thymine pyrophosphorylase clade 2
MVQALKWQDFARGLFDNEEADPAYYMLARSELPLRTQQRYVVAMFSTYYHHGLAGIAAQYQGRNFWDYLAGIYNGAPRASERRHFRGAAGMKALRTMRKLFPHPEDMVEYLVAPTYLEVRDKVKSLPSILVGDYFIWKYADAQDCVFSIPCDFTGAEKFSSTVPVEGAKLIGPGKPIEQVYAEIVSVLKPRKAPPFFVRPCLLQEAETVCCFWHKVHMGKYHFGAATAKAYGDLSAYPCAINRALQDSLMAGIL